MSRLLELRIDECMLFHVITENVKKCFKEIMFKTLKRNVTGLNCLITSAALAY